MSTPDDTATRPPVASFRPDPDVYEAAQHELHTRRLNITDFFRACLNFLIRDPAACLAALSAHWPDPRPRGWQAHRDRQPDPAGNPPPEPSETKNARLQIAPA